jgi:hypothetical protein
MESRVELGRRFEKQRVVLDRRQPCDDSDGKCSIRKAPSAPLRNTRRFVHHQEGVFRQKVRNLDDLLAGHPFLADKKDGHPLLFARTRWANKEPQRLTVTSSGRGTSYHHRRLAIIEHLLRIRAQGTGKILQ